MKQVVISLIATLLKSLRLLYLHGMIMSLIMDVVVVLFDVFVMVMDVVVNIMNILRQKKEEWKKKIYKHVAVIF